jgi:hypothetical protein
MRQLREVLRLKFEVGLSHRAIVRACGVGLGTVSDAAIAMAGGVESQLHYKQAFHRVLDREVRAIGPCAVVEESGSRDRLPRLIEAGHVKDTIPQVVAAAHGLPHSFLPDLTDDDSGKLGLPSLRDADLTDEQKQLKHDERETRWMDAMLRLEARLSPKGPLLAVVGTDHLPGLTKKLGDRVVASLDTVRELDFDPNE